MIDYLYGVDEILKLYSSYCELIVDNSGEMRDKFKQLSIIPTFLFYGLPSTGKTSVANQIYNELKRKHNIDYYSLRMDQITSYNFGESSKNLIEFFDNVKEDMKKNKSKAFIIIDEIDSFTINRYNCDNDSIRRILLTFNKIIDELIQSNDIYNMIIIGTTNVLESIDTATLRRFYFKQDFDYILAESQFKEYIDELCEITEFKCNDIKDFYSIYQNKHFTLGEIKRFFAEQFLKKACQDGSSDYIDIDSLKCEKSIYEYCKLQKENI